MVDLITRRTSRNPDLRRVARLPATTLEAAGAMLGMPTMGRSVGRIGDIRAADMAPEDATPMGMMRYNPDTGRVERWSPTDGFVVPDRLSVEELSEKYGDVGLKFDKPLTDEAARMMYETKRAEMMRDSIAASAPGGVVSMGAMFGAGLIATATDPLELASSFIPFVGPAGKAALVARLGGRGGRAAAGAIDGALGNALLEPAMYGLSRQMQLDYSMVDALTNVTFGAILGGVGGALARARGPDDARLDGGREPSPGGRVAPDTAAPVPVTRRGGGSQILDPETHATTTRAAVAQAAQGRVPVVDEIMNAARVDAPELPPGVSIRIGRDENAPTLTSNTMQVTVDGPDGRIGDATITRQNRQSDQWVFTEREMDGVDRETSRSVDRMDIAAREVAIERGGRLVSPDRVTVEDVADWQNLARRGYAVRAAADLEVTERGGLYSPSGRPAFEVVGQPPGFKRPVQEMAQEVAQRENRAQVRSFAADAQASEDLARQPAPAPLEDVTGLQAQLDEMGAAGLLTDADRAELAELVEIDRAAAAAGKVAEAGAMCLVR